MKAPAVALSARRAEARWLLSLLGSAAACGPVPSGPHSDAAAHADASDAAALRDARPLSDAPATDAPVSADVPAATDVPTAADVPAVMDVPVAVDVPAPVDVPPATPAHYYASTLSGHGTVDANTVSYEYAPAFVFDGTLYHYFACVGVSGDYVQHKSSPTLAGLASAPLQTVLSPAPGETHNCDPAVVRGNDGNWYLHYSNTPGNMYTDSGVAVASRPEGPYTKISMDLLGHYSSLAAGEYGRGQTTVTLGPDNNWYMAFTNQIAPLEPHSIVVLRSPDPSFAHTRTEVTRIDPGMLGGWSTQLSFDPASNHFVFIEPGGAAGFVVTSFDTDFHLVGQETLPLPAGAGVPGEGQAFVTDAQGRLLTTSPDANGSLVVGGSTEGPARSGFPTWITGPNEWRTFRVDPLGIVDVVSPSHGSVHVAGWSFDPNDRGWPLQTHIYVGLPDGSMRVGTNAGPTATDRPDVNATQGTTGVHGFDVTIPTALRGTVQVCTAAINIGSGNNTWLDCRNVDVAD